SHLRRLARRSHLRRHRLRPCRSRRPPPGRAAGGCSCPGSHCRPSVGIHRARAAGGPLSPGPRPLCRRHPPRPWARPLWHPRRRSYSALDPQPRRRVRLPGRPRPPPSLAVRTDPPRPAFPTRCLLVRNHQLEENYMRITTTIALAVALTGAAFTASAQETEYTPMTRSERFRNYLAGTVAPGSLAGVVARAGFEQWRNSPTEWGQGSEGFSDRLGNAYAKHFIRRTLEFGASSALHQDDRYLASGEKGFWRRTKYAVASTFLA